MTGVQTCALPIYLAAEEAITGSIREIFPNHAFLCEEKEKASAEADRLWIIDPLDGTNNFAHRFPHFCVSIAYAEKGEVLSGVVLDPVRDDLYSAEKGKGAFLNRERVSVSGAVGLSESIIATGFYYDRDELMEKTLQAIGALFRNRIQGIRRTGSAALDLCYVGCGRLDGFFEYRLSPWDFAAAALFITEADGTCSDSRGETKNILGAKGITASNGRIHDSLLTVIQEHIPYENK